MTTITAPDIDQVRSWLPSVIDQRLIGADDEALSDLGWDSLALTEVVIGAEHDFGSAVPDELLVELRTLGDLIHYIANTAGRLDVDASGDGTRLVPVTAADEPMLFDWFCHPASLQRFRLRGVTPSPETFHQLLWHGVLCQFITCREDSVATGLVTCFEPDHRNRHAHLAVLANPEVATATTTARGLARLITYVFAAFDARKLYAHVLGRNYAQVASLADRYFTVEGRLVEHEFIDGAYDDLVLLAVTRDRWIRTRHWTTSDIDTTCDSAISGRGAFP